MPARPLFGIRQRMTFLPFRCAFRPFVLSAGASLAACGFALPDLDYRLLARDVYVSVGGEPIVLPLIAVHDLVYGGEFHPLDWYMRREAAAEERDAFVKLALDPDTAPAVDLVEVNIGNYGLSDDAKMRKAKARDLCPNLMREWSRVICTDAFTAMQAALPINRRFHLVDLRRMVDLNGAPGAQCAAKPSAVPDAIGKPTLYCPTGMHGSHEAFAAIMRIRGDLGAVWAVSQGTDNPETAVEMADREGTAIMVFVRNGLGPRENFQAVRVAMPLLRRPPARPVE